MRRRGTGAVLRYSQEETKMTLTSTKTVGEIAAATPNATREFEKLGIDYCCGGNRTLGEACAEANISIDETLARLEKSLASTPPGERQDWQNQLLADLIAHITSTHHLFVREESPRIEALAAKVVGVHGKNHPELLQVQQVFSALSEELSVHLMKEEQVLFPYVLRLEESTLALLVHDGPHAREHRAGSARAANHRDRVASRMVVRVDNRDARIRIGRHRNIGLLPACPRQAALPRWFGEERALSAAAAKVEAIARCKSRCTDQRDLGRIGSGGSRDTGKVRAPAGLELHAVVRIQEVTGSAHRGCVRRVRGNADGVRSNGTVEIAVVSGRELDGDTQRRALSIQIVPRLHASGIVFVFVRAVAVGNLVAELIVQCPLDCGLEVVVVVIDGLNQRHAGARSHGMGPFDIQRGFTGPT